MRIEHSAGAVLYTVVSGEPRYVLVTERSGYASLPKGHLEEGETPAQAALREIREETGISAPLTTAEPLWQDGYALRDGGYKQVDYFLARFDGQAPVICCEDVVAVSLVPFREAWEALGLPGSRRVLEQADAMVRKGMPGQ